MKKFQGLGKVLSKEEQKAIMGGQVVCTYNCTCNNGNSTSCQGTSTECRRFVLRACGDSGGTCGMANCVVMP